MLAIIPQIEQINSYVQYACEQHCCFEYNDFMFPQNMDDEQLIQQMITVYQEGRKEREEKYPGSTAYDTLHGAFFDTIHFSNDKRIREVAFYRMHQSVEVAEQLGCRGVIFHTNVQPEFIGTDQYTAAWLYYSEKIIREFAAEYPNIQIYFENVLDHTPDLLVSLCEKVRDVQQFGVCLDIAHMLLRTNRPEDWYAKLSPYIKHMHLNDHDMKTDLHLAVGAGKISWEKEYALIQKYNLQSVGTLLEVNGMSKIKESLCNYNKFLERIRVI